MERKHALQEGVRYKLTTRIIMKKIIILSILLATIFSYGCEREDLDDIRKKQEELQQKIDDLEWRVESLEEMTKWANREVNIIKSLLSTLENEVRIVSYSKLTDGSGYELALSDNSILILKNGISPIINVKKHSDGVLYWTLNGDYILDPTGQMIKAEGHSGEDGQTPVFRINVLKQWEVSLDDGVTWNLVKDSQGGPVIAEGKQGEPGKDGDVRLNIVETEDSLQITYMGITYVVAKGGDSSIDAMLLKGRWVMISKTVSEDDGETWQEESFAGYWVEFNDDSQGIDSDENTFTYSTSGNILQRSEPLVDVSIIQISSDKLVVEYEKGGKVYKEAYDLYIAVTGIELSMEFHEMIENDQLLLIATVTPDNASNSRVSWNSSNTAIATVDETGLVTAIARGSAIITAISEDGNIEGTCAITVISSVIPISGVTLSKTEHEMEIGEIFTLAATIIPENATNKNLTWTSNDPAIASVAENTGVITALTEGTTIITVTTEDGAKTATCVITVVASAPVVTGKITFTTTKSPGEQIILRIGNRDWINGGNLSVSDLENFWIDLNNNGVKDTGEAITTYEQDVTYTVNAQTITLHGNIQDFRSIRGTSGNGIVSIDVTENPLLARFEINLCDIEGIDFSNNPELKEVYIRSCKKITSVNVQNLTELAYLSLESSDLIASVDVTKNSKLEYLNLDYCRVKNLDISRNKELEIFFYRGAQHTDLAACRQIIADLPARVPADNARATFDNRVSFTQADKDAMAAKNWQLLQP